MGKLNNKTGVEIIPLSDNEHRPKMQRIPYMSDPTIVPRVQKYLETNIDKTYVDINIMADDLQGTYKEYSKRKRSAFRAAVKKAYSIVLHSYGLEDKESSEDDDDNDDIVSDDSEHEEFQNESMNNQMVDLYSRPPAKPKQIDENELIDISSDDSEEEAASMAKNTVSNKKTNGPSTSEKDAQLFGNSISIRQIYDNRRNQSEPPPHGKKRKLEATISPLRNAQKKKKSTANLKIQEPAFTFKDIGGMDATLEDVCKLLLHIKHPELYKKLGISPPRGFLLHGPPGCGKTLLAKAIAGELNVPLIKVAAPELVAGVSGESEERIRELFERAASQTPCVLFIDEIDAITPNRQNAQKEMERRIVAQLLSCLDDLNNNEDGDKVLVIGATNRPDSIDPALRRAGRFDREICLGIPDVQSRSKILKVLTANLKLNDDFDYDQIAKYTPGYVGADLLALTREAAMVAVNRVFNELKEARKVEQALALEKAQKESKKPKEKQTEPETEKEKQEKSDPEIIVDDDQPKCSTTEESTDGAVVVVDDVEEDASKSTDAAATQPHTNGDVEKVAVEVQEESIQIETEQEPMPVDQKPLTTLEELLLWLHDKSPVNDHQLQNLCITMDDFAKAMKCVQPSAKREGFATVPDTTWDDVGSLRDVREELQMSILAPVRHTAQFESLGLGVPAGVLLCGPPGCGKTLLAKAIANEAGINFISVKGPELLNMYVGESERAVRVCFERARNSAPCVIFFDELDALCPKRSDSREGGATMRVVNQMLTEMDGLEARKNVFLLAASNRPDIIDPAVLRPGRLDKILYVGLPTPADRADILRAITKNGTQPRLASDVDLGAIGLSEQCEGYTGADLAALVREAGIVALKEFVVFGDTQKPLVVTTEHFKLAVTKIRPSVSEKDKKHYEKLRRFYAAIPEQNQVEEMEYS